MLNQKMRLTNQKMKLTNQIQMKIIQIVKTNISIFSPLYNMLLLYVLDALLLKTNLYDLVHFTVYCSTYMFEATA